MAAPLAGVLGMDWKKFLLFNLLGAAAWVTSMAVTGYVFATQFETLLGYFDKASWAISVGLFIASYLFWRHYKVDMRMSRRTQPVVIKLIAIVCDHDLTN